MEISEKEINELWSTEKRLTVDSQDFMVHRMSYGDYFIEPISWKGGERDGFSPDVQWFKKVLIKNQYGIDQLYYQL